MAKEEPIVVLEKQVSRLLEAVKHLKKDNNGLRERVKQIDQKLAKKQNESTRWANDRSRVEARVRKILAELDTLAQSNVRD